MNFSTIHVLETIFLSISQIVGISNKRSIKNLKFFKRDEALSALNNGIFVLQ